MAEWDYKAKLRKSPLPPKFWGNNPVSNDWNNWDEYPQGSTAMSASQTEAKAMILGNRRWRLGRPTRLGRRTASSTEPVKYDAPSKQLGSQNPSPGNGFTRLTQF